MLQLSDYEFRKIISGSKNNIEAYDRLIAAYCDKHGLDYTLGWAEKTPRNAEHYQRLHAEHRGLKFVSLVRDGRDVVTSKLPGRENYHCTIERYINTIECIFGFDSPRHLIVRYEDLVTEPVRTLKHVFKFIEIPFDEEVFRNYKLPSQTRDLTLINQPKVTKKISPEWIGSWHKPEHTKRIEEFMSNSDAMAALKQSGYY